MDMNIDQLVSIKYLPKYARLSSLAIGRQLYF